ncbi:MAG: MBL fold metallo-hydrolase, partial [Planctomycetaceae bacterium]|nr:MBL fold metallo-hydrolase [Planctomycetaceae bacterium]
DDLRICSFQLEEAIPLYCEAPVESQLRQIFAYAFTDPTTHAHAFATPRLRFETIEPGKELNILGLRVLPIRLKHGQLPILGFRIGNVAFCTDVSTIPQESRTLLEGLDVLIIDALRYEPHPTHLHVDAALQLIRKLGAKQAWLTHMSHDLDYETLERTLPNHVRPAWDGLTIPLDSSALGTSSRS